VAGRPAAAKKALRAGSFGTTEVVPLAKLVPGLKAHFEGDLSPA
jgi:hypothetical protein